MAKAQRIEYSRIPGIYEPIERTIEYPVCDKCGSAELICLENKPAPQFSGAFHGAFTLVIVVSFYGGAIIGLVTHTLEIPCGLSGITVIALLLYGLLTYPFGRRCTYKCSLCGNEDIT